MRYTKAIHQQNSISELKSITINNSEQWLLIRGEDNKNPVILFLHGGPGTAQIGYITPYLKDLEKDYIVVNWDQRGAGLSYSPTLNKEDFTIEQFIQDGQEVLTYLCERFNQRDIYLVGHSWGSLLGLKLIDRFPDLIKAYISVGQVTDWWPMERAGYEFVLEEMIKRNHQDAIKELTEIGPPPYEQPLQSIPIQRKWLSSIGGAARGFDLVPTLIEGMEKGTEYTSEDIEGWGAGTSFSFINLHEELFNSVVSEEITRVEVPITFFAGRYDMNTSSQLAYQYYEQLEAPIKEFVWFEKSAHFPYIAETDKFVNEIRSFFTS